MKNTEIYFHHNDISLCSLLAAQGFPVEFIEKHGKRATFYFKRSEHLDAIIEAYWSRKPIEVIPASLFEAARYLKSRAELT